MRNLTALVTLLSSSSFVIERMATVEFLRRHRVRIGHPQYRSLDQSILFQKDKYIYKSQRKSVRVIFYEEKLSR